MGHKSLVQNVKATSATTTPRPEPRVHSRPGWDAHGGAAQHLSMESEFRCIATSEILSICLPTLLDVFKVLTFSGGFICHSPHLCSGVQAESLDRHPRRMSLTPSSHPSLLRLDSLPHSLTQWLGQVPQAVNSVSNLWSFPDSPPNGEYLHTESLQLSAAWCPYLN